MIPMMWQECWSFETERFKVVLEVAPEDMDPAESFQFPEDIEAVRSGAVDWFVAKVAVYGEHGEELARDVLGRCAYRSVDEFVTSHRSYKEGDYFTTMVSEAISGARQEIQRRRSGYAGIKS